MMRRNRRFRTSTLAVVCLLALVDGQSAAAARPDGVLDLLHIHLDGNPGLKDVGATNAAAIVRETQQALETLRQAERLATGSEALDWRLHVTAGSGDPAQMRLHPALRPGSKLPSQEVIQEAMNERLVHHETGPFIKYIKSLVAQSAEQLGAVQLHSLRLVRPTNSRNVKQTATALSRWSRTHGARLLATAAREFGAIDAPSSNYFAGGVFRGVERSRAVAELIAPLAERSRRTIVQGLRDGDWQPCGFLPPGTTAGEVLVLDPGETPTTTIAVDGSWPAPENWRFLGGPIGHLLVSDPTKIRSLRAAAPTSKAFCRWKADSGFDLSVQRLLPVLSKSVGYVGQPLTIVGADPGAPSNAVDLDVTVGRDGAEERVLCSLHTALTDGCRISPARAGKYSFAVRSSRDPALRMPQKATASFTVVDPREVSWDGELDLAVCPDEGMRIEHQDSFYFNAPVHVCLSYELTVVGPDSEAIPTSLVPKLVGTLEVVSDNGILPAQPVEAVGRRGQVTLPLRASADRAGLLDQGPVTFRLVGAANSVVEDPISGVRYQLRTAGPTTLASSPVLRFTDYTDEIVLSASAAVVFLLSLLLWIRLRSHTVEFSVALRDGPGTASWSTTRRVGRRRATGNAAIPPILGFANVRLGRKGGKYSVELVEPQRAVERQNPRSSFDVTGHEGSFDWGPFTFLLRRVSGKKK